MNAAIQENLPAGCSDLDPTGHVVAVEAPRNARQSGTSGPGTAHKPTTVEVEYGCVDWYQYQEPDEQQTLH
jgi:hypothetical protein